MPRTQEFALLAFLVVQVSISQGGRRLPPQKGTSKDAQGFGPYQNKKRGSYRKRPYGGNSSQSSNQAFSSGRGNRISEAPRVLFDPTLGEEGVETPPPPPNDSLKASLSPPVGGCLRSFRRDWQTNKCANNVLNIITNGYHSFQNQILPEFL